jgi:hypothetical protein
VCEHKEDFSHQKHLVINGINASVDKCIYALVAALNLVGLKTVACCCGHGTLPTRISLEDGRELIITDYDTAQVIASMAKNKGE